MIVKYALVVNKDFMASAASVATGILEELEGDPHKAAVYAAMAKFYKGITEIVFANKDQCAEEAQVRGITKERLARLVNGDSPPVPEPVPAKSPYVPDGGRRPVYRPFTDEERAASRRAFEACKAKYLAGGYGPRAMGDFL